MQVNGKHFQMVELQSKRSSNLIKLLHLETAPPTKLQTGLQFLTKDFLRFWMADIHWEGRG